MFEPALHGIAARLETEAGWAGVAIVQGHDEWTGTVRRREFRPRGRSCHLLYSFTKSVLAAATLRLVASGRLSLDEPISRWLNSPAPVDRITLRQLLQHTSGLPDYGRLRDYHEQVRNRRRPWTRAQFIARTGADELLFEPGTGWAYSNIGYLLVGEILSRGGRAGLGQVLTREVFEPLGIDEIAVVRRPGDLMGYDFGPSRYLAPGPDGVAVEEHYHPGWIAHGVLGATPLAAARLLHGIMTTGFLPFELLAAMRTPVAAGAGVVGRPWQRPGYGLGLMIEMAPVVLRAEGHTGAGPGCSPAIFHFAQTDPPSTICVVTNGEDVGQAEEMVLAAAISL